MRHATTKLLAITLCLLGAAAAPLWAADAKATTVSIPGVHCAGCAKKVTDKLAVVVGVEKAEADMTAKTVKITARAGKILSPKAIWEAVEAGGQKPSKMEGPSGTFTTKPKS